MKSTWSTPGGELQRLRLATPLRSSLFGVAACSSAATPVPAPRPPAGAHIALPDVTRHNLNHLDVEIPRERLTVLTGVSGSGKSSLLARWPSTSWPTVSGFLAAHFAA